MNRVMNRVVNTRDFAEFVAIVVHLRFAATRGSWLL